MVNPVLTGVTTLGIGIIIGSILFLVQSLRSQNDERHDYGQQRNTRHVQYRNTHNVRSSKFDGSDILLCTICMDLYGPENKLIELQCAHKFHGICIKNLLLFAEIRPVCPICRNEIDSGTSLRIRNFK